MELALTIVGGVAVAAISGLSGLLLRWWLHRRRTGAPRGRGTGKAEEAPNVSTGVRIALAAMPQAPEVGTVAVHNLGPRPDLLGRDRLISSILDAIWNQRQPVAIFGPPGIGKSSVAVEAAYQVARSGFLPSNPSERFKYVLCFSGRLRPLELTAIMDEIARWTGNLYIMQLPDLETKLVEIRKIFSHDRSLLILDNLETVVDKGVYELAEKIPYPSRLVTTSRRHHPELASARHIEVPAISGESSEQLLQRELAAAVGGPRGTTSPRHDSPHTFARLRTLTQGNPLAIRWAAGQLQVTSPEALVNSLDAGRADLFRIMFESTWRQLTRRARRIMAALTRLPSPPTIEAVFGIAGSGPNDDPGSVLIELTSPRLIELADVTDRRETRVTIHPLTHAFVAGTLDSEERPVVASIEAGVVAYYVKLIAERGGRDWDDPEPLKRIDLDRENYLRAARIAYDQEDWPSVMAIVDGLRNYLLIFGYWAKRLEYCRMASRAADLAGDVRRSGRFVRHIGWTLVLQGDLAGAEQRLAEARTVAIAENDTKGEADATGDLAEVARLRGNLMQSRNLRKESLRLSRLGGQGRDIYVEQTLLAQLDLEERNLDAAREGLTNSMRLAHELRWHRAIAYCLHWLGDVARLQGDFALAHSYLRQSRDYLTQFHDRARLVLLEKSEALLAEAEGDTGRAWSLARRAIVELRRIGLPYEAHELDTLITRSEGALDGDN